MRVVLAMLAAMSLIVTGDAAGKLLTEAGVAPFTVAWARFAVAALVLTPLAGVRRAELPALLRPALLGRAALIAAGIACILTALRSVQLADAFAAFFVGPVVSYLLSVLLLGERVSAARTALLVLSFGGVLIVVRPGGEMQPGIGWALAAGCFYGSYLVATRALAPSYRPRFLLWSQLVAGSVLLAPFGVQAIPSPSWHMAALFAVSALGSAFGNLILVWLNRTVPASVVAPLVYTQLLAAAGIGWLVFGDWPDATSWAGLAIIIGAGALSVRVAARGG